MTAPSLRRISSLDGSKTPSAIDGETSPSVITIRSLLAPSRTRAGIGWGHDWAVTGCARRPVNRIAIANAFSVQPLCALCLCGETLLSKTTTETQSTQRLHREEFRFTPLLIDLIFRLKDYFDRRRSRRAL